VSARPAWIMLVVASGAVLYGLIRFWLGDLRETTGEAFSRLIFIAAAIWASNRIVRPTRDKPLPFLGVGLVFVGAIGFLPGWFVLLQVGPRQILLWWELLSVITATSGAIAVLYGVQTLRAYRFPLLFPLFALPVPGRIMAPVQLVLQDATTWLAANGLSLCGVSVDRSGFVLSLPAGVLGVVEACSGIRSVSALVAIAVFMSHVRGFGFFRSLFTVVLSVPIIVFVNGLRVIGTGLTQEWIGKDYIDGVWHDTLGIAMVLLGLALVSGLTALLAPAPVEAVPATIAFRPTTARRSLRFVNIVLGVALAIGAALSFVPGFAISAGNGLPLATLPPPVERWTGKAKAIDPAVTTALGCDTVVYRIYTDGIGNEAHVWVVYWSSANAVRDYHHPDVCWPNRGFQMATRWMEPVASPAGRVVPVTFREFTRGSDAQIVGYWTQEGRHFWTDADEAEARSPFFPIRWMIQRANGERPGGSDDRLTVLVAMPALGTSLSTRAKTQDVMRHIMDEVYDACPWADPQ